MYRLETHLKTPRGVLSGCVENDLWIFPQKENECVVNASNPTACGREFDGIEDKFTKMK